MGDKRENRIERIVSDLLHGRRLRLRGGDAEEKEAIIMAARLAAARQGPQRMSPGFRQKLARQLESAPEEGWLTRRAALVAGLGVAAGALGGGLLGRGLQTANAPVTTASVVKPVGGRWIDVGALEDFAPGQARQVKAGAVGAFVVRQGDSVSAVSSICSDLPCELWFDKSQGLLACPCHNQTFTVQGRSTNTVYPLPSLDTVIARVTTGGRVEVLGT
ncbi:MAG TPA: Rieske 2Fe-2S domain-containing protein [Candidatus Dormibacteraeota bacterium]|nr:Rieske 2Fe-2S domain-containing protein [Candidatus Dormibacteraeota bacterium]